MTTTKITLSTIVLVILTMSAVPGHAGGFSLHVGSHHSGFSIGWWDSHDPWSTSSRHLSWENDLAGYGEWIWVSGLGRVWQPWVQNDWRPYTHGRWVSSVEGWTWVAYEPWGYIPHHFGEWALTSYGWAWVPGSVYRPANVVWLTSGVHVGWYPAAPNGWSHHHRGYHHGYRYGYNNGYHNGYDNGYWDGWRDSQHATFVHWKDISNDNLAHHAVSTHRLDLGRSNTRRTATPRASDVRRHGARALPTVELERRTVSVDGRSVNIARPRGLEDSRRRHGRATAERALAPEVATRYARTKPATSSQTSTGNNRQSTSRREVGRDSNLNHRTHRESRSSIPPRGNDHSSTPQMDHRRTTRVSPSQPPSSSQRNQRTRSQPSRTDRPEATTVHRSSQQRIDRTGQRHSTSRKPAATDQREERSSKPAATTSSRRQSRNRSDKKPETVSRDRRTTQRSTSSHHERQRRR